MYGERVATSAATPDEDEVQQPLLKGEEEEGEDGTTGKEGQDVTTISLTCFACIALSAFLGDASRGLVVPSIVPFLYLQGANSAFVGYVNGAYSAARLVSAPLFGYWAEKRTFKESVIINLVIFITGNMIYILAGTPLGSPAMILVSRFLVGLGSGTLGLARGYVVLMTSKAARTHWMAYLTAAQFIGYSVTPGIGALLSLVDVDIIGDEVEFDGFTGAGYVMVMLGVANLLMMVFLWKEPARCVGVLLYAVLQFVSRSAVAVYETLSQLIAVNNFRWGIFLFGLVSCAFGTVGTIVLFLLKPVSKHVSDENVLFVGLFAIGMGYVIFTPWWGGVAESTALMELQYSVGSVFIFGIGFPITQALILSLFSKLLGPMQQSTVMGFMASFGSAARVLGAVVAGWAFQTDQMQLCLIILIVFVLVPSGALWAWHFLYTKRVSRMTVYSGALDGLFALDDLAERQRVL